MVKDISEGANILGSYFIRFIAEHGLIAKASTPFIWIDHDDDRFVLLTPHIYADTLLQQNHL